MAINYARSFGDSYNVDGEVAPVTNPGPKEYIPPAPMMPQAIIDYEKKREEKRIEDRRPVISIEDIADPERN